MLALNLLTRQVARKIFDYPKKVISFVLNDQNNFSGVTLNVREAAEYLGWSEKMLRARLARRTVPFRRLGGRLLFRREELLLYLDQLDGCTLEEALFNQRQRREK